MDILTYILLIIINIPTVLDDDSHKYIKNLAWMAIGFNLGLITVTIIKL